MYHTLLTIQQVNVSTIELVQSDLSWITSKRSDMARVWQGHHTVLPATHTRTIPAFNSQP